MGIQLPPELVEVAAKAGVTWPEADEDAMRASAAAWRDAGNRITGLAGESDGSATKALSGISGATGDAARAHWNGVVAPDGDLNTAAKGCHAAADRLEHGAEQIGAAKVELVRELVNLAKNNDAAQSAAAAGHPTALLGLETALAGATANVANLANTLAASVRLDSGVDVGATTPPVNANPGSHGHGGGLLDTVGGVVDRTVGAVAAPVAGVVPAVTGAVPGALAPVTGALPVVADVVPAVTGPVTGVVSGVTEPVAGVVSGVTGPVSGVTGPVADVVSGVTEPVAGVVSGVVPAVVEPVVAPVEQVVPAVAAPVVAGVAPVVAAPGAPVVAPAPAVDLGAVPPVQPLVSATDSTVAQSAATLVDRPLLPADLGAQPQAPAQQAPAPAAQAPAQAPGFTPAAPGAPAAPAAGAAVVGAVQRTDPPVSQRLGDPATGQRSADPGQQRSGEHRAGEHRSGEQRAGEQTSQQRAEQKVAEQKSTAAQPQQTSSPAATGKELRKPEDPVGALVGFFYFRAFPSGADARPSVRPSRQVEPSAPEVDHVDGLRFAPRDHPHADLVDASASQPRPVPRALAPDHPLVRNLTDGYDPQAGLHEREWDARFVRRADPLEHTWPPAAVFPEGGYEAGRPDVLPAGTEVDRFGTPEGRVLAAAGTRFACRSLPPTDLAAGYRRYVVSRPVPVWRTISVGWFGQPGGGTRYRTTYPVADLVALGYLMELT
ncbi:TNT domain-containing protein [Umezawaea sp.]|uniref:TNT domain-containing protein n=1 Tax=Umezawaea sp. TaxID=1955258 RepID=UPI002ED12219